MNYRINIRIQILTEKKLIGKKLKMSFANNRTGELWRSFMPERNKIMNKLSNELISMQIYLKACMFKDFNEHTEFEKWATVEVSSFGKIPEGMEKYVLKGGLYLTFIYKGTPSTFPETLSYIFNDWLPTSEYEQDDREHFEILGDKYKRDDPQSEEEVWIPIKPKNNTVK